MSTRGGTSHSGMDSTSTTTASSVEPSDHNTLDDARSRRCRLAPIAGKRRWPTRSTMAGVMNAATSSRHSSTMTGVASTSTIKGREHGAQRAQAQALEPAKKCLHEMEGLEPGQVTAGDRAIPEEIAQGEGQRHHQHQRQEGQTRSRAGACSKPPRARKQSNIRLAWRERYRLSSLRAPTAQVTSHQARSPLGCRRMDRTSMSHGVRLEVGADSRQSRGSRPAGVSCTKVWAAWPCGTQRGRSSGPTALCAGQWTRRLAVLASRLRPVRPRDRCARTHSRQAGLLAHRAPRTRLHAPRGLARCYRCCWIAWL